MNAVDTHVHCWDLQRTQYSWLDRVPELNRTFDVAELEEERLVSNISTGVLVQAANSLDDTAWMLKTATANPWIKGVVGWLPLTNPSETARLLDNRYSNTKLVKGIRHLIHDEADPKWLLQSTVLESLQLVANAGLSFDFVGVNKDHLKTALVLASRLPTLKLVFDHLNQPPSGDDWSAWAELMTEAAKNPNYHAKISGLGTAVGKGADWKEDDIRPAIEFVLKIFGNDRCFCGGDWPVSLLAGTYGDAWAKYRNVLSQLLDKESQQKVLAENAIAFYRL